MANAKFASHFVLLLLVACTLSVCGAVTPVTTSDLATSTKAAPVQETITDRGDIVADILDLRRQAAVETTTVPNSLITFNPAIGSSENVHNIDSFKPGMPVKDDTSSIITVDPLSLSDVTIVWISSTPLESGTLTSDSTDSVITITTPTTSASVSTSTSSSSDSSTITTTSSSSSGRPEASGFWTGSDPFPIVTPSTITLSSSRTSTASSASTTSTTSSTDNNSSKSASPTDAGTTPSSTTFSSSSEIHLSTSISTYVTWVTASPVGSISYVTTRTTTITSDGYSLKHAFRFCDCSACGTVAIIAILVYRLW